MMNDKEFYKLHCELDGAYLKLNYLQNLYRRETGRSFVFGQSYKPRSAQPEDSPDYGISGCIRCACGDLVPLDKDFGSHNCNG